MNITDVVSKYAAEQQYKRDKARVDAHNLALKDDEFNRLSELIREEVRNHVTHLQYRYPNISLNDHDSNGIHVWTEKQEIEIILFNAVRHQVTIKKTTGTALADYSFTVTVVNEQPVVIGRKWKVAQGALSDDKIVDVIRGVVELLVS